MPKIHNGRKKAPATNGTALTGYLYRKTKIDPYLSPCTKLKCKWIKDLNIKQDTLHIIEKKVGKSLDLLAQGGIF